MTQPISKRPDVWAARRAVEQARALRAGANSATREYRQGVLDAARRRLRETEARALSGEVEMVVPEIRGTCLCGAAVVRVNDVLTCAHGHDD